MRLTDVYYGLEADGSYSITMDVFQAGRFQAVNASL